MQLQQADLFVLPCRVAKSGDRDGIPVALMEAMASGIPVIAGDLPPIRELVSNGENGLLVEPDAVVELSAAISQLLCDREMREHFAARGRERVVAEFDLTQNVNRIATAIMRVHSKQYQIASSS